MNIQICYKTKYLRFTLNNTKQNHPIYYYIIDNLSINQITIVCFEDVMYIKIL